MGELQLPPSVRDTRGQAIEGIVNRLAQIDLSPILVYRIDSVPDSALPFLAWQFDVADALFQLLAPGFDKRTLIKNAIALKRQVGTPAAIKTALANLGWTSATILEGQNSWGGTFWPANEGWAVCRILINLGMANPDDFAVWQAPIDYAAGALVSFNGNFFWAAGPAPAGTIPQFDTIDDVPPLLLDGLVNFDDLVQAPWVLLDPDDLLQPISAAQVQQITAAFNFFKPARCWLDSVWFVLPAMEDDAPVPADKLTITGIGEIGIDHAPTPTEGTLTITITMAPMVDAYGPIAPTYNAHFKFKGVTYGQNEPQVAADGPIVIGGVADGRSN